VIDFLDEFIRIVAALEASGVEYAVCGGWALALHGAARATDDIDLVVTASGVDAARETARGVLQEELDRITGLSGLSGSIWVEHCTNQPS